MKDINSATDNESWFEIPTGPTGERPPNPVAGQMRFDTTENVLEYYNPSVTGWREITNRAAVVPGEFTQASGGTVTTSGDYKTHTFTGSADFVVSKLGDEETVQYLVVGGGGGGGSHIGGGGGAGGMLTATGYAIAVGTHAITIGAGGAGSTSTGTTAGDGGGTIFGSIATAQGGGGGGTSFANGRSGGSGGGAGHGSGNGSGNSGGAGTSGQGYAGGRGRCSLSPNCSSPVCRPVRRRRALVERHCLRHMHWWK